MVLNQRFAHLSYITTEISKTFCLGLVINELIFNPVADKTDTKLPEKKRKRKTALYLKYTSSYLIRKLTKTDANIKAVNVNYIMNAMN